MPTTTADHQDIAGLQVPHQNDAAISGASNLTASSFGLTNGADNLNDANGFFFSADWERQEVEQQVGSS